MMQVYWMRVNWISGIAVFVAFVLTFWPSRFRMIIAATLWATGILAIVGLRAYDFLLRGGIGYAFSATTGFPLYAWLIPLISLLLAITECVLLFPWIPQQGALRIGTFLFLTLVPAFYVFQSLQFSPPGHWRFPLGFEWVGYPLLWFRIRENLK